MMRDFLMLFAGLFISWTGVLLGVHRERARKPKPTPVGVAPRAICGCEHGLAMHDLNTAECHAKVKTPKKYDEYGDPTSYSHEQCTCRQYTGPRPIDSVFQPPVLPPLDGAA